MLVGVEVQCKHFAVFLTERGHCYALAKALEGGRVRFLFSRIGIRTSDSGRSDSGSGRAPTVCL